MAKGILIAAMNIGNAAEDEFHDWYDTEHLPERTRVPGFLVCQRWIGADDRQGLGRDLRPRHGRRAARAGVPGDRRREPVAVVEAGDEPGRAADAVRGRPDPARRRAAARQCRRASAQRDECRAGRRGRIQRMVRQRAHPGARRGARRAVRAPLPRRPSANRRYVALYHLVSPDVQATPAWKNAADTEWTRKLRPHFRDHLRLVCRKYVRGG